MPNGDLKHPRRQTAKPEFARPTTPEGAMRLIVETLAYYEHCRESFLDKLLEHQEQEAETTQAYANAKDLAYLHKLCTKEARGEYVKTVVITPEMAETNDEVRSDQPKAFHAIIAYQGSAKLTDALGEELKHADTELSIARRMHDSAMMIGAIFAGIETEGDRSGLDMSGLAVKVATKKVTTKKR